MTVSHSPFPWVFSRPPHGKWWVGGDSDRPDGVEFEFTLKGPHADANRRLLEALPAMVEALQYAVRNLDPSFTYVPMCKAALRAAGLLEPPQPELKPCPFCGSQPAWRLTADGRHYLECVGDCTVKLQTGEWVCRDTAVKGWNRRAGEGE